MNKYINLMIHKFETYIYMLDSVEPTNDTAIFLNGEVNYKEINKVERYLQSFDYRTEKFILFTGYLKILRVIYRDVYTSSTQRNTMIVSLNNAIHCLNKMNKELVYENY